MLICFFQTAVSGLSEAYSFGDEFAAALSVVAIALTGDPTSLTWSIGGPYQPGLLGGLLSNPQGISFSHNTYESDASPGRVSTMKYCYRVFLTPTQFDAYLNNGDAHSLDLSRFDQLYFSAENYTLDILRDHNKLVHDYSIQNNPYFFSAVSLLAYPHDNI